MISLEASADPVVSVLILCQDNLEMLIDCLASVARTVDGKATPYEVIVLFQQTARYSVDSFFTDVHGVRQLHAPLNLGFGGGNNYASKYAKGRYLLFLNDDTIVHPGWLQALLHRLQGDPTIGAVGSRLIFPDGTLQEAGAIVWRDGSCYPLGRGEAPGSFAYSYVRDVDYASANGMLLRRSTFDEAAGFDTRFYPGYYEDVDLCLTLRHKLGLRVAYEPKSVIVHRESATSNRDPGFREFLFHRHRMALCEKWSEILSCYPTPQPESVKAIESAVMRARGNPRTILVVDDRVPAIGMGSGAGRIADMLEDLASAGYAVDMCPTDRARMPTENTVGGLGVNLVTEPLVEHLERRNKRYDAVIISRPHNFLAFEKTIRKTLPDSVIIYDVEALYHRRLFIQARAESDPARRERLWQEANDAEAREIEIVQSADRLVAISEDELAWLSSIAGHPPIEFMRPLANNVSATPANLEHRRGAVFVAGWLGGKDSPNVQALQWYAREVVPRVRDVLPDFVTYVSGNRPPANAESLESSAIVLVGLVRSVESLYRNARVAIAPILAGSGVKIKAIEALQFGVPVVATTVGGEGLGLVDREEIDVSDDPDEYAKHLIALVIDDGLWTQRREAIARLVDRWEKERVRWGSVVNNVLR